MAVAASPKPTALVLLDGRCPRKSRGQFPENTSLARTPNAQLTEYEET